MIWECVTLTTSTASNAIGAGRFQMRSRPFKDWLYLAAVALCAVAFAANALSLAVGPGAERGTPSARGSAGQPRPVDVEHLRRLIRQGYLSEREAEFAEPETGEASR